MKVAFLGIGVMGAPMAGHLAKKFPDLKIYNRTLAKAKAWQEKYGNEAVFLASTPKHAVQDCDFIFLCLGNDDDVRSVFYGEDGILAGTKAGAIIVDHTTSSADLAQELATSSIKQGINFLDAPVSGGQAGAENGALTMMVGGNQEILAKVTDALNCYAAKITFMGKNGSGQIAKMVNQIFIGGLVQSLAEGLNFAMREGLDTDKLLETLSGGAAQSWQMVNRGKTMVAGEFDFGFALDWMVKDLGYCLARGKQNGSDLEITQKIYQFYQELSHQGLGRMDTSALIKRLQN